MFATELIAGDSPFYSLDLSEDLPVSVNMAIADIREPENRDSTHTKTVKLPGTKTNNQFFEHLYEVNIATSQFNPNVKVSAVLLSQDEVVMDGHLRLIEIEHIEKNGVESIEYSCTIVGTTSTLFSEIGDNKLEALDFSEYNHAFTRTNQENSWDTSIIKNSISQAFAFGTGYIYPLIDYGRNGWHTNYFHVQFFAPAIYALEYVKKIFTAAGKTFTSTFLNGAFFKRLIIPHNDTWVTRSTSQINNSVFFAGRTAVSSLTNSALTFISGPNQHWQVAGPHNSVNTFQIRHICNVESPAPFNDAGNVHDVTTGIYTVSDTGYYQLKGTVGIDIKANFPAGAVSAVSNDTPVAVVIYKSTDGGTTWSPEGGSVWNWQIGFNVTTSYQSVSFTIPHPNSLYTAGTKLRVQVKVSFFLPGIRFFDGPGGTGNPVTTGTASIDVRNNTSSNFGVVLTNTELLDGQTVDMNNVIPREVKQKDFLLDIFRLFNLYVDIDKNDPNNYIIETRNDFFSGTVIDWTDRWATDQPTVTTPMGELQYKVLQYRYKEDKDYFNRVYQDGLKEPYGSEQIDINNDWVKGTKKTEVMFSPTPIVDNTNNDIICPKILDFDGTLVKPIKSNIRILYYAGVKNLNNPWTYASNSGNQLKYRYPFAGMVDDALSPTLSIEWDNPLHLFYSFPSQTYTNNTLFNKYYSQFVNEITDRDSKIVKKFMRLSARDIAIFDFRKTYYIGDAYFIVNRIIDYDPLKNELTEVEFLKIKEYPAFSPEVLEFDPNVDINFGFGVGGNSPENGGTNNYVAGENNYAGGEGSLVTGKSNFILSGSENIQVMGGNNNMILNDASNISLINSSNQFIPQNVDNFTGVGLSTGEITTDDNGVFKSGQRIEGTGNIRDLIVTKTDDFTTERAFSFYRVDATAPISGADLVATLFTPPEVGWSQTIKKISQNDFNVEVVASGGALIDDKSNFIIRRTNEAVVFTWNGTKWETKSSYHKQEEDISVRITDQVVANTVTETTVLTGTLNANRVRESDVIYLRLFGFYSTHNAAVIFTLRLKLGGTTILSVPSTAANVTNAPFASEFVITCRSTGATGSLMSYGIIEINNITKEASATGTTTIDTTINNTISATLEWDTANPGSTATINQGFISRRD